MFPQVPGCRSVFRGSEPSRWPRHVLQHLPSTALPLVWPASFCPPPPFSSESYLDTCSDTIALQSVPMSGYFVGVCPPIWLPVHPKCRILNHHLVQTPVNGSGPLRGCPPWTEHPGTHSCLQSAPGSPAYKSWARRSQKVRVPAMLRGHGVTSAKSLRAPGP